MKTFKAKRIEITIEAVMERRLTDALASAGVTGYTILPVLGGSGRSGRWSREGQVSRAAGMVAIVCIIKYDNADKVLDTVFGIVDRHYGVVSVTDCEIVRPERF
ncbi:MAG: transcriptional regulator [Rhodobacteraceae bacterium]|nr:transcriptional regulator [Paracoccaceae bacterium]